MPRISVVMSVYNGLPYLAEAVRGILSQTYADFEFIIIDDASTDGTWAELRAYAAEDGRIILLQNSRNQGYTRSLNRGLEAASGEFIARQDADDISRPDRFARQIAFLEDHPEIGLLGTLPDFIDSTGAAVPPSPRVLKTDNESLQADLLDGNGIWHGSVLIRRGLLKTVGHYEPDLEPAEDYDLWLRLAEVTGIANLPERLYCYRLHDSSESQRRRAVQIRNKASALERAIRRRYAGQPPADVTRLLGRDYLRAAVAACAGGLPEEQTRECMARAIEVDASVVSDMTLLERVLRRQVRGLPTAAALQLIGQVFDDLLSSLGQLDPLKRRLLSDVHMRDVAARVRSGSQRPLEHFWPAIRLRPRKVVSRSTWSLLTRGLFSAGAPTEGDKLRDASSGLSGPRTP
jgi:glycosyltransferase involved in cell wall biosynthesis